MFINEKYMKRALELARGGELYASPNPMVGAVIVDSSGRIIGEGWHRRCGEAHAEVNAVASVADESLLRDSTMYVTLEPCAHYGRTGPCSLLIIQKKIPRVVVGVADPFAKVNGRGISMLREAGVEVHVGCLEDECRSLNARFFTAHTHRRPFITLKWAQSADGFMDRRRAPGEPAAAISNALTAPLMHRQRALNDAILVGSGTFLADNPGLDNRLWPGRSPRPIVLDRRGRCSIPDRWRDRNPLIVTDNVQLPQLMTRLYEQGITSLLVEGGPTVLNAFIDEGLWDLMRVETSPELFGDDGTAPAPLPPRREPVKEDKFLGNIIRFYSQNPLVSVKNL